MSKKRGGKCLNGCCPNGRYSSRTHKSNRIFLGDATDKPYGGLLPNLTRKTGMQDLSYYYIQVRGPTNSAVLYSWLKSVAEEYNRKGFEPKSIQQLSQILTRSPLFNKVGKEAQRAESVNNYTYEYPLWDIHDVDEVAQRIVSKTHRITIKRYAAVLQKAITELEVAA